MEEHKSTAAAAGGGKHHPVDKSKTTVNKEKSFFSNFLGSGDSKVDDESLSRLVEMGFDLKKAKSALKKTDNDID